MKDPKAEKAKKEKRERRFLKTWRQPVRAFLKLRFNYTCKTESIPDGPFLLYANHVTDFDPVFVAASFNEPLVFVAGENVQRMGKLSSLIRRYASTIDRVKGSTDSMAAMNILRTLRSGRAVCMFPSGNRSYCGKSTDIFPASAKLAIAAKVPLITYKLTGGYMTSPRWSDKMRKGKMHGEVVRIYTPEELAIMQPEELLRQITNDLYEDAYAAELYPYKGKRLAERLETMLYLCPKCGGIDTLTSKNDTFSCSCGFSVKINEYGRFEGADVPFEHPGAWDEWQQEKMRTVAAGASDDSILADEGQQLYRLDRDHNLMAATAGKMTLSGKELTIGNCVFPIETIDGIGLTQQDKLSFTSRGENYVIRSDHPRCGKKYYDLFRYMKG